MSTEIKSGTQINTEKARIITDTNNLEHRFSLKKHRFSQINLLYNLSIGNLRLMQNTPLRLPRNPIVHVLNLFNLCKSAASVFLCSALARIRSVEKTRTTFPELSIVNFPLSIIKICAFSVFICVLIRRVSRPESHPHISL
jgi:hypothetical protein